MIYYNTPRGKFGLGVPAQGFAPVSTPAANTHILFMNKCTGGCTVTPGTTDNRTDRSSSTQSMGTLSAFSGSAATWTAVMSCMQNTFSRFNITITDVDPGTTAHMEVMVAGTGSQLGAPQGVLGYADLLCQQPGSCSTMFETNALVFDFANDPYYSQQGSVSNNANEICATAAQEIAHSWALDHVVDASDPMTYNSYDIGGVIAVRQYKDAQKCGSDCQGGQSPLGLSCTGSNDMTSTHTCMLGQTTQNEVQVITGLFGASAPDTTPPVVAITAPSNNASVMPAFSITATVTDNQFVMGAEAKLDGTSLGVLSATPFTWKAPTTLTMGSHHIEVIGTDGKGNTASATEDVAYGTVCTQNSDCPDMTQVCDHSVCVAGPTSTGGLGSSCTSNTDCASGSCGNDGTSQYCVSSCDLTMSTCPSGFQCLDTGGAAGVCWPGESGGGGCNTSGNSGAPMMLFGLGAMFLVMRRRV
jgi:uncharacterized protein (TIGR03382 family)